MNFFDSSKNDDVEAIVKRIERAEKSNESMQICNQSGSEKRKTQRDYNTPTKSTETTKKNWFG